MYSQGYYLDILSFFKVLNDSKSLFSKSEIYKLWKIGHLVKIISGACTAKHTQNTLACPGSIVIATYAWASTTHFFYRKLKLNRSVQFLFHLQHQMELQIIKCLFRKHFLHLLLFGKIGNLALKTIG